MKKLINSIFIVSGVLCVSILGVGETAHAQAATTLNFQSKIVNKSTGLNVENGSPSCVVSGADTCDFRIDVYDASSSGTLLFSEVHADVELGDTGGQFSLRLNSVCDNWSSPPNSGDCKGGSGITWGNDPTVFIEVLFAPAGAESFTETFSRQKINSAAFSFYADSAGSIQGYSPGDFVQIQPSSDQTATANRPLIALDETGVDSPDLINIKEGGNFKLVLNNLGALQLGNGTAGAPSYTFINDTDTGIFRPGAANNLAFVTNGSEGFRLDENGNIGVGVTNPTTASLDIAANTTSRAQLNLTPSGGTDVSSPTNGDLWWNGTNLYFNDGSGNADLLAAYAALGDGLVDVRDDDGNSLSNQVMVRGWGAVVDSLNGAFSGTETDVPYGITFDSVPTVALNPTGYTTSGAPSSIADCSTYSRLANFSGLDLTTSNFDVKIASELPSAPSATTAHQWCFVFMAVGEYTGADLSENFLTYDINLEAGDLVSLDTKNDIAVKKSENAYEQALFGVVSTAPGEVLGGKYAESADRATPGSIIQKERNKELIKSGKAKAATVALAGRVPVKVSLENGIINKGDYLTASSTPGVAMRATKPGQVVGRALEDFDGTTTIYQSGDPEFEALKNSQLFLDELDIEGQYYFGKLMVTLEPGFFPGLDGENIINRQNIFDRNFLLLSTFTVVGLISIAVWQERRYKLHVVGNE